MSDSSYLHALREDFAGAKFDDVEVRVSQFVFGQSNPTYFVQLVPKSDTEDATKAIDIKTILSRRCLVLRRQPPGRLLPK